MGQGQARHVYNLSSRDVQIYAISPDSMFGNNRRYSSSLSSSKAREDDMENEKFLIGTVGFKTSKTLKFPPSLVRVTLIYGDTGSICEIPICEDPKNTDLIVEECVSGLRPLRIARRDDKIHGERLIYVVNVDAINKLSPALAASLNGSSEQSTPASPEQSTMPTAASSSSSVEHSSSSSDSEDESSDSESMEEGFIAKSESRAADQGIDHRRVKPPPSAIVNSTTVFGAATCMATSAVTGGVAEYRKQQHEMKQNVLAFLTEDCAPAISTEAAWIIVSYIGVMSLDWKRLARRVTKEAAKGSLVGGVVGTAVAGGMVAAARGAAALEAAHNIGAATLVRGVGSGLGVVLTAAITACEVGKHVRDWKRGRMHVRECHRVTTGSALRGAVNATLCGLAILPVAGVLVAVIGGVVFNICDATYGWTDTLAGKLVPVTDGEKVWKGNDAHRKLLAACRSAFGLSKDEPLDEKDLNRRLRKWMLSLHPDKNQQQEHPYFHTIVASAAILINEAREEEANRQSSWLPIGSHPFDLAEEMNPYDLLPLMDVPDSPSPSGSAQMVSC